MLTRYMPGKFLRNFQASQIDKSSTKVSFMAKFMLYEWQYFDSTQKFRGFFSRGGGPSAVGVDIVTPNDSTVESTTK